MHRSFTHYKASIILCFGTIYLFISAGGNFSLLESFKFTRSYGKSCQNISIPHSELDPFTDAVFTAEIVVPAEPVFELGAVSSASLTIEGIERKKPTCACICRFVQNHTFLDYEPLIQGEMVQHFAFLLP